MRLLVLVFLVGMVFPAALIHSTPFSHTLNLGDEAPDFELADQNGTKVRLSSFRDSKNVVLAFYVLAFTGG